MPTEHLQKNFYTPHSIHSRMNRTLAHDIVCYAEVCVTGVYPRDVLDQIHSRWESRYFAEYSGSSPSIAALISEDNRLITDAVILSLEDRRELVGLRIVLAIAGVSIGELRYGLAEDRMAALTTGFCRLGTSTLQIHSVNCDNWHLQASRIIEQHSPRLLVVEGLRFGRNLRSSENFSAAAKVLQIAGVKKAGLLLFD